MTAIVARCDTTQMAESFIASVQYGDMKGTVAFDGHNGAPLHELAAKTDMPGGYVPVGFTLWKLEPEEDGLIPIQVVAVDARDHGSNVDEIAKAAEASGELQVYPFDGRISLAEFTAHFKRFELKAIKRNFKTLNVVEYSKP